MDTLISEVLLHLLGRIGLNLRYRSKEKLKKTLNEKYAGSYTNAGRVYLIYVFAIPFGLALFALFIMGLISIIFQ